MLTKPTPNMTSCKPKILVEGKHLNVAQCMHCNRVGVYYKNVLVGFTLSDFFSFSRSVAKLDFQDSSVVFSDLEQHLIIETCHHDIQFTFLEEEFQEFTDVLNQAMLIIEATYYATQKR